MNAFHKWVAYRAILARFFSRIEPDLARIGTQPMDAYGHRVILLNPPMASAGPARQRFSDHDLERDGIARLGAAGQPRQDKDGTHG